MAERFRWTQVQPADSGEAVTALTSAGGLFQSAISQAQKGLDKYKSADERLLAEAQAKNLSRIQDKVSGVKTLGQYGAMSPDMQRDALRQKYTDAQGNVLVDIDAATGLHAAQRDAALQGTMFNLGKDTQTDLDTHRSTNLSAMQSALQDIPEDQRNKISISESGNLTIDPTIDPLSGQRFEEKAREYGFMGIDSFQDRRKSVRDLPFAQHMSTDELKAAETKVEDILKGSQELSSVAKTNLASAEAQAQRAFDQEKTVYDARLEAVKKGLAEYEVRAVETDATAHEWINSNLPEGTFRWWIGDTKGGNDLKSEIESIKSEYKGNTGRLLSDKAIIAGLQYARENDNWIFDEGADVKEVRKYLLENSAQQSIMQRVNDAAVAQEDYITNLKDLEDVRLASISKATAAAMEQSGVRNTAGNKRVLDRLRKAGDKAKDVITSNVSNKSVDVSESEFVKKLQKAKNETRSVAGESTTPVVSALTPAEITKVDTALEDMIGQLKGAGTRPEEISPGATSWDDPNLLDVVKAQANLSGAIRKETDINNGVSELAGTDIEDFIKSHSYSTKPSVYRNQIVRDIMRKYRVSKEVAESYIARRK